MLPSISLFQKQHYMGQSSERYLIWKNTQTFGIKTHKNAQL